MSSKDSRVLVTDCWTRKGLSTIRGLGEHGITVDAMSHKRLTPAFYSKYARRRLRVSNPKERRERYAGQLVRAISEGGYDTVMPLETETIEILQERREEVGPYTKLLLPTREQFEKANDKWHVFRMAEELGIPAPRTLLPDSWEEASKEARGLGYPLMVKARSGSGSRGTKKVEHAEQLEGVYRRIQKEYGDPMLQACIRQEGTGVGVACLASGGVSLVLFSYRRLREYPVKGGPSTLRESTDDPRLKDYAARLMERLRWIGVAMVEFKVDPGDGVPKLMEINPRFWGSMELARVSGVDFPYLLYRLTMGEPVEQPNYNVGVRCRWLLPGDVSHFLANPRRLRMEPSFFRFFEKGTYYDQLQRNDLKGSLATVICTALSAFDPETWKLGVLRDR
jgi:predicted ATP-grasp superfamily ATP-dependent carboligase